MAQNNSGYSVLLWGSHPDADNDDCHMGYTDVATLAEAKAIAVDWYSHKRLPGRDIAFSEIDGVDYHEIIANPGFKASRRNDDSAERSERAMQAGMAFGCDGYNDEMGY
jgi:hypothetical protein